MITHKSISKIKITEAGVFIDYTKHFLPDIENEEEFEPKYETVQSKNEIKPHRDFVIAFTSLSEYAMLICELSKAKHKVSEDEKASFEMKGVSFHENLGEIKVVLTGVKYLSSGKTFTVNTPNVEVEEYEGLSRAIKDLEREADLYLNGKNGEEQLQLFDNMKVAS